MVELKNGSKYEIYEGKNTDQFTWNRYDNKIKLNDHGLLELVINTNDFTLLGS